jgi:hypothetical protein
MIDQFIPSEGREGEIPLERYLDPMPGNVVSRYIEAYSRPGSMILDPFCQTAVVIEEAVRKGRSALAAHFSPLNVLIARATLSLPPPEEIDTATTRLGGAPKLETSLREHIIQLYATSCHRCRNPVVADHFVWDREQGLPVEKGYRCPHCEAQGDFPVEGSDLEALAKIEERGVHYWYLLDRLASPGEEGRELAQSLLELYTPRNLYALVNLSMKVDALFSGSPILETLQLILLICLDTCRKLEGEGRARLRPPRSFRERNVWHAFEEAYIQLRSLSSKSRLSGNLPPPTEAIVNRSVRGLARGLERESLELIITAPPPLDGPFWALSYLWTGWLLGKEETTVFKPLLRPRSLDWSWYQRATAAAMRALTRLLRPEGRIVFILGHGQFRQAERLILAGAEVGLQLERLFLQPCEPSTSVLLRKERANRYRLSLVKNRPPKKPPSAPRLTSRMRRSAFEACRELLQERGDPLLFEWLHAAILKRWNEEDLLRQAALLEGVSLAQFAAEQMEETLKQKFILLDETGEIREDEEADWNSSLWWLKEAPTPSPLGDQVEKVTSQLLQGAKGFQQVREEVYSLFPGLLTPDPGLVEEALHSYGQGSPEAWRLRPPEEVREEMIALLLRLGERLGFQAWAGARLPRYADVAWREEETSYLFLVRQKVSLGDLCRWVEEGPKARHLILIPDERTSLLRLRLEGSPLIRKRLAESDWDFVKLGHLRSLAAQDEVDRHDLKKIVGLLPPIESAEAQLPLFP